VYVQFRTVYVQLKTVFIQFRTVFIQFKLYLSVFIQFRTVFIQNIKSTLTLQSNPIFVFPTFHSIVHPCFSNVNYNYDIERFLTNKGSKIFTKFHNPPLKITNPLNHKLPLMVQPITPPPAILWHKILPN